MTKAMIEIEDRDAAQQFRDRMPLANGSWTTSLGATVTVSRVPTPEGRNPQVQIRYRPRNHIRKQGYPHTVWYPDVARCYARAQRVLDRFAQDMDSLGQPMQQSLSTS